MYSLPQIQHLQLYWSWECFTPENSDQNSFAELPESEQNRIQSTLRFLEEDAYSDANDLLLGAEQVEAAKPIKFNLDHFFKTLH